MHSPTNRGGSHKLRCSSASTKNFKIDKRGNALIKNQGGHAYDERVHADMNLFWVRQHPYVYNKHEIENFQI